MELIDDLDSAADCFADLLRKTSVEDLTLQTPCSDWDVRALLNHVVSGALWFTSLVDPDLAEPDRTIDRVKDAPLAAFEPAAEAFHDVMLRPAAFDGIYQHRRGPVTGVQLTQMRTNEYLVHAWDLAIATGEPTDLPEDLVVRGLDNYRELLASRPRGPGESFGIEVPLGDGASPTARLVAFCGRDPR